MLRSLACKVLCLRRCILMGLICFLCQSVLKVCSHSSFLVFLCYSSFCHFLIEHRILHLSINNCFCMFTSSMILDCSLSIFFKFNCFLSLMLSLHQNFFSMHRSLHLNSISFSIFIDCLTSFCSINTDIR